MISSLAAQTETQYLPLDSLMEVYKCLFELSQDMVEIIIESKEDVVVKKVKNKELSSLVDLYLKNITETLNLFDTVDNFVERAKNTQLIIRRAVKQFEAEPEDTDLGGSKKKKKYAKTLEELNEFKAKGDPLGEEFAAHYKSVFEQQVKLLEDLCEQNVKLDKKLQKLKSPYAFFGVAAAFLFLVLACIIPPAAHELAHMAKAHVAQLAQPIETIRVSVSEMLNKYETQKDLLTSTEDGKEVNKGATETINFQVENLRGRISFILKAKDFAVEREEEEEEATRLAMQEIMKNVEEFTKKIEEVGETAAKFSKLIVSGRCRVLEHINNS